MSAAAAATKIVTEPVKAAAAGTKAAIKLFTTHTLVTLGISVAFGALFVWAMRHPEGFLGKWVFSWVPWFSRWCGFVPAWERLGWVKPKVETATP